MVTQQRPDIIVAYCSDITRSGRIILEISYRDGFTRVTNVQQFYIGSLVHGLTIAEGEAQLAKYVSLKLQGKMLQLQIKEIMPGEQYQYYGSSKNYHVSHSQ